MATFVLVHGAWHGGWCWADVEAQLLALGHRSFAPTLTGLGERSHLINSEITADTHAQDIANFIRWRELRDVILVGHSYGGMVITGAAGRIPEALRALVYLDAFVPEESGVSIFARANPERMANFQKEIDAGAVGIQPDNFDAWTDDPDVRVWLERQCTPQPVGTFLNGVTLSRHEAEVTHKHFIICARNAPSPFWAEYEKLEDRPDWTRDRINTKHNAMVEDCDGLVARLDSYARTALP